MGRNDRDSDEKRRPSSIEEFYRAMHDAIVANTNPPRDPGDAETKSDEGDETE